MDLIQSIGIVSVFTTLFLSLKFLQKFIPIYLKGRMWWNHLGIKGCWFYDILTFHRILYQVWRRLHTQVMEKMSKKKDTILFSRVTEFRKKNERKLSDLHLIFFSTYFSWVGLLKAKKKSIFPPQCIQFKGRNLCIEHYYDPLDFKLLSYVCQARRRRAIRHAGFRCRSQKSQLIGIACVWSLRRRHKNKNKKKTRQLPPSTRWGSI